MKYVMFTRTVNSNLGKINETFPVIFPDIITHIQIVTCVRNKLKNTKPISAGFLNRNLEPYGESVSLDMQPHENDGEIISNLIRLNIIHID